MKKFSQTTSVGNIYLDINGQGFPNGTLQPEIEIKGDEYQLEVGGSAFNFAKTLAHFGLNPNFIGKVGADQTAAVLVELIKTTGVDSELISSPDVQTNMGINLTTQNGKTLMAVMGSANQSLQPEGVRAKIIELLEADKLQSLYLGGVYKLEHLIPMYLKLLEEYGSKFIVLLDHGRVAPGANQDLIQQVQKIASFANYYLPSENELMVTWEADSVNEALKKIREAYPKLVVLVKLAEKGCLVAAPGKDLKKIKAFSVEAVNTVGAGDTFNAGLIAGLNQGLDLIKAAHFANATAAIKISQNKIPSKKDVEKFIAEHKT